MAADDAHQGGQVAEIERLRQRIQELEAQVARQEHGPFEHLQAIIDHAPLAIYLKDAQGLYLLVNREYERLSARPREQTLGRTDFDVFPPPVAQLFREQDRSVIAQDAPQEFRETVPLPDGVHSFITSKFPLRSASGALLGVAGLCTDVTELQGARDRLEQTQAELVRQARLATLGELAAVVAHEVRNPLGVVFNAVATLKRHPAADLKSREMLEIIGAEADRLNRMVGALLELARPPQASFGPANIERMAASAIDAARAIADPAGEVQLTLAQPLPESCLDEHLVNQALANLVCNALQAAGRQRPVEVRVELVGRETVESALRFHVVDDGAGVPADIADRIFAPFFTTRATGTGLGLTVALRVAEAHRGTVRHTPTPGGGATFTLEIPFVPPLPEG
ncbi:MAG: PAS domain-containing protein [Myxococcales bacterium]